MKNISLYAYSIDQEIMDWLQFLVEKEDSKIIICKSEQELEQLYEHSPPASLNLAQKPLYKKIRNKVSY